MKRLMEITKGNVSEEQEGFTIGKGCVDQILAIKMKVEMSEG